LFANAIRIVNNQSHSQNTQESKALRDLFATLAPRYTGESGKILTIKTGGPSTTWRRITKHTAGNDASTMSVFFLIRPKRPMKKKCLGAGKE